MIVRRTTMATLSLSVIFLMVFFMVNTTQVDAQASLLSNIKKTISAKCTDEVKKKNPKLANACDGRGVYAKNANNLPQAAKRLLDICNGYKTILNSVNPKLYNTGGVLNGGKCDTIKNNNTVKTQAAKAKGYPAPGRAVSDPGGGTVAGPEAESIDCSSEPTFFGIPTWYKYLERDMNQYTKKCEINFSLFSGGKPGASFDGKDLLLVGLAVIDILLRVAALVAVAFVIVGGVKYTTSQGSPDVTKGALTTILNSLIGLAIAVIAAALVGFIGNTIK